MPSVGLETQIVGDFPALTRAMRKVVEKQLPFASSKALTTMAFKARDTYRGAFPRRFTSRRKSLAAFAFRADVSKARKTNWPNQVAAVGVHKNASWLVKHEKGGMVSPEKSRRHAIPTKAVERKRTRGGSIPSRLKPRNLDATVRGGVLRAAGARGFKRGKGKRVSAMFLLRRRVRIAPKLGFERTVTAYATATWPRHFNRELRAAIGPRHFPPPRGLR